MKLASFILGFVVAISALSMASGTTQAGEHKIEPCKESVDHKLIADGKAVYSPHKLGHK
jgi:hypothetical protein